MADDQYKISEVIDFSNLGTDQTSKVLFRYKKFLAKFLQLFLPMFKNMSIDEIIEQTIDWHNGTQGDILFQESEESNSKNEPQIREDYIVMLRFPDHLQKENHPKYFILHIEFQNSPKDLDRRQGEYATNLNLRFNITPNKQNEEARRRNLIPIYTVWIILHPNQYKGLVEDFNGKILYKVDPVSGDLILEDTVLHSTNTIRPYRINLDNKLSNELKNIPNIMGFLNGFFCPNTEVEFEEVKDLYDMHISDEFEEEAKKMDACLEYQFQEGLEQGLAQGREQGLEQGLAQGLEQGLAQGLEISDKQRKKDINKITQGLIKEMGFSQDKAEEFIKQMLGPDSEVK